ncbi:MJ0042 family finger-like domain-containing protein [Nitrosomonas sp. Nm51]|uniref:zinc-ribbon and DUF3426 domain-containing protein n=1 Tax=Nitrosomonas sp. Nm51 TaxID=133720 RepID=UPI0008D37A70|nr:zinc-ribbon and DUF3426 domain-containing protein [Nitrosomonas sp. Nm51]SEQ94017.1 MJ0042 family finger-like domain-containing protein [Nitrosomonas sp. Nm51]
MALVTLCPGCGTTYKIYPEQLQAQNGLVRCGKCQVIFNGFSTLITIDETEIEYLPAPADNSTALHDDVNVRQMDVKAMHTHRSEYAAAAQQAGTATAVTAMVPEAFAENAESDVSTSDFLSDAAPENLTRHRLWQTASVVLFFVLMVQVIMIFRSDLAIQLPQTRSYLEQLCDIFGCSVPLPANIQLLSIVSSDLQVSDPENQPDVATLTAIIRNHAAQAQALPALKLSLTDMHGQMLASRIFTAADYLSAVDWRKTTILPNHEITVRLYLDNSQLNPIGYRLQILYI